MNNSTFFNIEKSISPERLAIYKTDGAGNEVALARYIYNHERISHWKDLEQKHDLILDFINWMSHDMHKIAEHNDTFDAVYKNGIAPFEKFVQDEL